MVSQSYLISSFFLYVQKLLSCSVIHAFFCSGYMAPEYAYEGHFSSKSDVFSFGVLLLEIVSGKRNSFIRQNGAFLNLLGYVSAYA